MADYEISLMVVVEADTVEQAVEQGREDLAHWAQRGTVNVTRMDDGARWAAESSTNELLSLPSLGDLRDQGVTDG